MPLPQIAQIQDLAIRCVQKNIKKNKGVKDWPWWKLFTTVRPLIEVQLTEDQIRGKDVRMIPLLEEERNNCVRGGERMKLHLLSQIIWVSTLSSSLGFRQSSLSSPTSYLDPFNSVVYGGKTTTRKVVLKDTCTFTVIL